MHLVRISIEGLPHGRAVALDFSAGEAVRTWTTLPGGRNGTATLVALAASIAPGRIAQLLAPQLLTRWGGSGRLRTEFVCRREGRDAGAPGAVAGGWQLIGGAWERVSSARGAAERAGRRRSWGSATPLGNLVLAYGPAPTPGSSDAFDFSDTEYPYRRIASLLDSRARLTDPVSFLERISAKAHELGTPRQKQFLGRLCRALAAALEPDERSARARGCPPTPCVARWATRGFAFAQAWGCLHAWERRAACVIIDVARHAYDAFPRCESPFDQSAVLLLDRPDCYCPGTRLTRFFTAAAELLEAMVQRGLRVNFNQTLDLRRLTAEHAEVLRRLHCSNLAFHRRVYHFSLNDGRNLEALRRRYDLLRVTAADHVEFVCMYGYNTSLAEDLERLRFLRSLPRAYVFMQRYQPIPGGPAPDVSRLFDDRAEAHLDALVRVVFTQNMKNVERYYRWLCLEYARQCGRIHRGLVDILYRYNDRHMRGAFLQQLEETARARDVFSCSLVS